ncbi:MAG TPA: hypothetical protein VJ123_07460, partial [Anaerolineales bacterium]|nr:hypothetical protein [Anaerolineales bacterium]
MLPRATWIPGGGRSDPGPEPTPPPPTPPPPTPPAPPSAGSGASTGPTQTARDRWWEGGTPDGGQPHPPQKPTPATATPAPPTPTTTPQPIPTPGPSDAAMARSGLPRTVGPSPETARRKDEDLIPTTTAPSMAGPDIEALRQSAWLWSHPDVLAAALTDNSRGQAYLGGILPHLQPSPTGRAVVEALLAHGKVNVDILPPELRALNGSVQPWVPSIYIY